MAEFVYITDDTYTKKQVLRMEHLVLKVLSFDLAAPTITQFLTHYFLNHSVNKRVESLAMVRKLYNVQNGPFHISDMASQNINFFFSTWGSSVWSIPIPS